MSSPKLAIALLSVAMCWNTAVYAEPPVLDDCVDNDCGAMKAQLEGVIDAYNRADPEAFAAAYTEDAWVISMRRPIKASQAEIKAAFTPGMSNYLFTTDLKVIDVEVHGDIAYMIGRSTLTGEAREGASVPAFVEERIYTAIFKRDGDDWLIHRHMESTSPVADDE
ncbi:MAG: nuclear transport factor 2 family protein [Gammaproteobacteria bacterium]|nr:nuclear transport factor 2 family protein [Gammaproteobacteria bacterium]NND53346.1 nuclear transport factor 2 family protein [Gammaproteobacteria bacterium]